EGGDDAQGERPFDVASEAGLTHAARFPSERERCPGASQARLQVVEAEKVEEVERHHVPEHLTEAMAGDGQPGPTHRDGYRREDDREKEQLFHSVSPGESCRRCPCACPRVESEGS